ncbi:hypothetical protein [Mycobacterium intracellulare]|uniref:hypothetical protein n=1 Tax=Mycobacterium intracellulare TaxID=1767 RepID=UPI002591EE6E|nr:hypothetical protein [Mycobacterium intracellulare]MDM3894775.1 hypothetical protein [Mycobacterium intracellulare]
MPEPVDLDDDDCDPYPPPWYSGPPPRVTRGPVLTAYVDTGALDFECINCGAAAGDFCRHDEDHGGSERKMPCPVRIATAARAHQHGEASA